MRKLCEKDNFSINISNNNLLRMEGSHRNVSAFNSREDKDDRSKVISHIASDRQYLRKDSCGSKHQQHSSTNVADSGYSDTINGKKQFASSRSAHRRSSSACSRSDQLVLRSKDTVSSVFQENPRSSALKHKMEKKSPQIKSLFRDTHYQCSGEEARGYVKTVVHTKPVMSAGAKHRKKTLPATKHDGVLDMHYIIK